MRASWFVGAALLIGCDGGETPPEPSRVDDILALTGDSVAGQTLWDTNCESCHAGRAAAFGDLPEAEQVDAMLSGPGSMPEFGGFSDQQLADLVAYMLAESNGA